ncbi:hypothetical protein BJ508DRAFT_415999 [Ascobolus immersus RN42]|uniref:Autophagy-related protein 17 n=1 Tax=Ascobolus immersus RN42 TaxID=1160509 RepID=A0A3N4I1W4_ASCIM|nr:hypothetical protein BJ508DRAFT_415999 [Ascobolus immersus RN42]
MTTLDNRSNSGFFSAMGSHPPPSSEAFVPSHDSALPTPTNDPEGKVLGWLVKSKQSLHSVQLCARANELVSNSRSDLQKSYALNARISFVTDSYRDQLQFAVEVNTQLKSVESGYREKFTRQIRELDDAEASLSLVLDDLKAVKVDPVFRSSDQEEEKHLIDFVDDSAIEGLKNGLRGVIDEVEASHNKFMETISAFDADITRLKAVLTDFSTFPPVLSKSPIIPHVEQLEEHAEAIAGLLESLTRHYDQCCLAMKELEIPVVDPVAAAERAEMLSVLETDGEQVDDAVKEIEERLASMENSVATNIAPYMESLNNRNQLLVKAFMEFDVLQNNLSVYLVDLSSFEYNQSEFAMQMDDKLSEMDGLRAFYETFRKAYRAMLQEADRRTRMQEKRNAVLKEAMAKLQQIDDEDAKQRETFRLEQGQFLPTDIWPALTDTPPKYVFSEVEPGYNEFGDGSMDNLKKTVLHESSSNVYNHN